MSTFKRGYEGMMLYVYYLDNGFKDKITLTNLTKDTCIVQKLENCKKSKKATAKIKYYNDKPYITCKGKRYYLDKFTEIEI